MPTKPASATNPSTATYRLLLHSLAHIDEANCARRDWSDRGVDGNREALRAQGAPYRGGGSAAQRQSAHRAVTEAADAGLLTVTAGRGERGGCTRPTDRGERITRSLIDYPNFADALRLLRRAVEIEATHVGPGVGYGHDVENGGPIWVAETLLAGVDPAINWGCTSTAAGRQLLVDVQLDSLPALFRGWLAVNADTLGRAWFNITDAGRRALEAGDAAPDETLPAFSQAAQDFYHRQRRAARTLIGTSRSLAAPNEIGGIPLSASIAPLRSEARHE